jgi:putative intracellular protease/amidase
MSVLNKIARGKGRSFGGWRQIAVRPKVKAAIAVGPVAALLFAVILSRSDGFWRGGSSTAEDLQFARSLAEAARSAERSPSPVRVAVFGLDGTDRAALGELPRVLDAERQFVWEVVRAADVCLGRLRGFDVAVFPGGRARRQAAELDDDGRRAVRHFVCEGGGFVGICGGAFLATDAYDVGVLKADVLSGMVDVPGEGQKSLQERGAGTVQIAFNDAGREVFPDSNAVSIWYSGGPIFLREIGEKPCRFTALATYVSEVCQWDPQRGTMIGTPAIVAARFGKGTVIAFSPHPEMTNKTEGLLRFAVLASARGRDLSK